jgi:chromosomal replication initiation ATPase DnaA|tara:strand:- start:123 stop:794 length:672 start_codon:yes stop_codon:yes gene_type:complete
MEASAKMSQLTFKFPFKTNYYEEDFYVSSNNFEAYKLIESWPNWPDKKINIFGPSGCGKTHLSNILKKKINSIFIEASELTGKSVEDLKLKECIIIDNYDANIEEELFYSVINNANLLNQYLLINSITPIKKMNIRLKDLYSRLDSFIVLGIELPTDDLLRVILTKSFSDKQIDINVKLLEYILKNIDRSYEKIFNFVKELDLASLSSGKSININLIKKVLNK